MDTTAHRIVVKNDTIEMDGPLGYMREFFNEVVI